MKKSILKYFGYTSISVLFSCRALSSTHHPQAFLDSIAGSKHEAEEIVQHFCATCHASKPIISLGAPKIGACTDWQPRLKRGIKILLKHTNEGFGLMPPRGGCFECSDAQLRMAIQYMLPDLKSCS